eukprot:gnl/TRDRNA2_/TRDRNA2_42413_c0_seq1.p1 gnl/TRDRNA2_/TRDRNA2_42413_c0~~gnl/TRDRNA2_/TRDRNA2_42413_c0_seq1.p1  ORF type:complete len:548 (-),score=93.44 gnl/TRDRNA2_/TRDRNA2_42413_c0_seq1:90-1733(-)
MIREGSTVLPARWFAVATFVGTVGVVTGSNAAGFVRGVNIKPDGAAVAISEKSVELPFGLFASSFMEEESKTVAEVMPVQKATAPMRSLARSLADTPRHKPVPTVEHQHAPALKGKQQFLQELRERYKKRKREKLVLLDMHNSLREVRAGSSSNSTGAGVAAAGTDAAVIRINSTNAEAASAAVSANVAGGASAISTAVALGTGTIGAGTQAAATSTGADASTAKSSAVVTANIATNTTKVQVKAKMPTKSWWAVTFSFAFIVKALCMASNVLFQASPFPQVRQFHSEKDTGEADAAPFVCVMYSGWQWCFYGLFAYIVTHKSGFLVLVYSNVVGALMGIYYVSGFQFNCNSEKSQGRLTVYYHVVVSLVLLQMCAIGMFPHEKALFFSGLVSSLCSIVGSLSLLSTANIVIETRCSKAINPVMVIVSMVSSVLWITCGIILSDAWIMGPNCVCIIVNLVAFSLVIYYPQDKAKGNWKFPPSPTTTDTSPRSEDSRLSGEYFDPTEVDESSPFLPSTDSHFSPRGRMHTDEEYGAKLFVHGGTGGTD